MGGKVKVPKNIFLNCLNASNMTFRNIFSINPIRISLSFISFSSCKLKFTKKKLALFSLRKKKKENPNKITKMRSLFQAIVLSWTFFNPGTEAIKNLADVPCGRPKEVL